MQCNGNFPGNYAPRNVSLDASGSTLPSNCHDKIYESGHYYNGFLSSDSLFAHNKEVLKQTILKHETVFRDQIQELHRIYRKQRELMDGIRKNDLSKHYPRFEASLSNTPFFQTSSKYDPKAFQVPPGFHLINPGGSQVLTPSSSVQGKDVRVCHLYPTESKACPRDFQLSESKCKIFGKDLQLPADKYIESEDKDRLDGEKVSEVFVVSSNSKKRSPQLVRASNVKSFFGSNVSNSVFLGSIETPRSTFEKQKWSADLNEPGKLKEKAASFSNGFMGPSSHSKLQFCDPPEKAKLGFQNALEASIQIAPRRPDIEVSTNFLQSEMERKQEQPSYHAKAGKLGSNLNSFLQGFDVEKSSLFPKLSNKDLEQLYRSPTFHQGNQSSSIERPVYDLESSRRNSTPLSDSHFGSHASFHGSTSNDHSSWTNMTNSGQSPVAVQILPCEYGRNPIAVQALPCFNAAVQLGNSYKLAIGKPELGGSSNLLANNHGMNFPSSNDVNLNSKPPSCSSEFAISLGVQTTNGAEKHENSAGGLTWLREKPLHNGKGDNGHGNLTRVEPVSSEAYSAGIRDVEPKKVDNLNKTCQNPTKDVKSKGRDSVIDLNLVCDLESETEIELTADKCVVDTGVKGKHLGFGCLIDLNSSINEAEFTQKPSLTAEIDLDAPASPENKESSPPRGESDGNQAETPVLLSGQDDADQQDELVKIAADAIVTMSSSKMLSSLKKTTFKHLEVSLPDSLHWFADIVSSEASNPVSELGQVSTGKNYHNDCEELLPDGMDYFEAMTLNLTETKLEECCYKSNASKEEETGTSSSPSQPRKGRTRRGGRQRKDFQTEILPSLASLSRYEVTEDLQTIGGLMEAAGAHWETGSTRYAARNGYSRGRKRSSVAVSSGVGCSVESMLKQLSSSDVKAGKEERSVICWGKVTRRRRGQRCPVRVGNQQLILSQV